MKLNSLDEVYVVSQRLVSVSQAQMDRAKAALGTEFPAGFEEFILRFGKGDFSGYLRPYDPGRIVDELASNREWVSHDFWEDGELQLTREERTRLVLFADTIDSDAFAFLPGAPEEVFVLPRHQSRLFETGPTMLDLINWTVTSGEVVRPFSQKFFQPWNDYASLRFNAAEGTYELNQMQAIFETIGSADYMVIGEGEESIDYFIQKFGAHFNYLLLDGYEQFIVTFDYNCTAEFLPLLTHALAGKGFRIAEHNRVDTLPDLS